MSHSSRISSEMPPKLRLVRFDIQEDLPAPLTYVVSRTRYVEPGSPCVLAALVDPALGEDYRSAEAEVYSAEEMRADRPLAEALAAWEAGDHGRFHVDRQAQERVEAAYRASVLRASARHPSVLGRA
jgi:hypothetical protein